MNAENKTDQSPVMEEAILKLLREIAPDQSQWSAARDDVHAFLERHNLRLPPGVSIELYELARDTSETPLYAPELVTEAGTAYLVRDAYQSAGQVPRGLIQFLTERNLGCPIGTMAYKTKRQVTKCVKYGVIASGLEWVPVAEGSPLGHFEYTDIREVCLQSVTTTEEVIECLPYYQLGPVNPAP